MVPPKVTIAALEGIPLIAQGDDLAAHLGAALDRAGVTPKAGDVLVVAQKVVSKAEGRFLRLDTLTPSPRARELAAATGKDPRFVEAVLGESVEVVRYRPGVIVVETHHGIVMANAGIDRSNVDADFALLLPRDPDASAEALRARLLERYGDAPAVVISDSVGRAWRNGTVGLAIGAAGLPALLDRRGARDLYGRPLEVTMLGYADSIASAAGLVMGEGAEGCPAVLMSGLDWPRDTSLPARALIRPKQEDMFR
jgi:coenzyme F420-0:L-glutamate ligase/coenzyme F420-1:gamma-L-glutamate ligase